MKPEQIPVDVNDVDQDGAGLGMVEILTWIGEAKKRIALVSAGAAVLAIAYVSLVAPTFTARTTLTAPVSQQQQNASAAAAVTALGSLSALSGLGTSLGGKTPDELYVALLRSDSVQRALAVRYKLLERYGVGTYEALRGAMKRYVRVTADKKSGVITVEVDDPDPKFAAELANAHATEVATVMARMAITEAQQRRAFFELQLKDAKDSLAQAEQSLRQVQEKSGMILLDKQSEAIIKAVAEVKARIIEREVQLRVLRTGATAGNPEVQRKTAELAALRGELARMETASAIAAATSEPAGIDIPTSQLPAASVEYARALREVRLRETLLANMLRQFEIARLDVAKDAPSLQQIDVAMPPDHKSKPARAMIVLGSTLIAALLSSSWLAWRRYRALVSAADPQVAKDWARLAGAWRLRRPKQS